MNKKSWPRQIKLVPRKAGVLDRQEIGEIETGDCDESIVEGRLVEGEAPLEAPLAEAVAMVERHFGYTFKDQELLGVALTHRSIRSREEQGDYERLEFLGDAVLDLAIAILLLKHHPSASEGALSKMRAALVSTRGLAELGREIKLGDYIRLSRGERLTGGTERPSILADVVEALIGAVFSESGFEQALAFVGCFFGARLENVSPYDPKTELQELLQARYKLFPKYELQSVEGPEHDAVFVSVVRVSGRIIGRGNGRSKKLSDRKSVV